MHFGLIYFLGLGYSLEEQYHRAANGCDVDGFESRVQDQHRLLHDGGSAIYVLGSVRALLWLLDGRDQVTSIPACDTPWTRQTHSSGASGNRSPPSRTTYGTARATTRPTTLVAPAPRNAREQASSVA